MSEDKNGLGFVESLFTGVVDKNLLIPFPSYNEMEREEIFTIVDMVKRFTRDHIDASKIDCAHEIPKSVIDGMKELGLWGLIVSEEYDGFGQPDITYLKVMEILNGACASTAVLYGGHLSIGMKAITLFGTNDQKLKYLPELAAGEKLAGFALTEPGAGSDAAAITTTAEFSADEKHYVLNGRKLWITNGGIADVFTVFAKVKQPGNESESKKISAFIIERSFEGFSSGKEEDKLGLCGSSTTPLYFDDVKVPAENLLGEIGDGFKIAMEVLNTGRLSISAGFVGVAKAVTALAVNFALQRRQFGKPIADFEMIREKFASIVMNTFTSESMVYFADALKKRNGVSVAVESAICKTFNSESLWETVNECLQITGGNGYMKEYPYERFLRDSRVNMIFEGTNEIQRMFIALTGLKLLMKKLERFVDDLPENNDLKREKIDEIAENLANQIHEVEGYSSQLNDQIAMSHRLTQELNKAAIKVVLKHGKELKTRQYIQKRIADAAIDLYGIYANIARIENLIINKHQSVDEALLISRLFAFYAEKRIISNLNEIENNLDFALTRVSEMVYNVEKYPFEILEY